MVDGEIPGSEDQVPIDQLTPEEANRIIHSHRKVRYGELSSVPALLYPFPAVDDKDLPNALPGLSETLLGEYRC